MYSSCLAETHCAICRYAGSAEPILLRLTVVSHIIGLSQPELSKFVVVLGHFGLGNGEYVDMSACQAESHSPRETL